MPAPLDWARRLQAIAQSGLTYARDPYDRERYEQVRAVAAELAASLTGEEPERLAALFAEEAGHATPKVDVEAAAVRDGHVLLVRNVADGRWSFPGGWAEVGETPAQAAEKELREESGYSGRAVELVGVYVRDVRARPRFPFFGYKLLFRCDVLGAPAGSRDATEISDVGWFKPQALPELSVRTSERHIADAVACAGAAVWSARFE